MSGRPRGEHPSKEELVEAAQRCFVRSGYADTTMRQVAEEAGTSVAQLYLSFANKYTLFVAVHRSGTHKLRDQYLMPAIMAEGAPWDRVMGVTEAYMRFYLEDRELATLLAFTSLADIDPDDPASQEMFREDEEQMAALFNLMGELTAETGSNIDPAHVLRWNWAAMYGLAAQNMRFPHLALSDDELEKIVDVGMRLVRGGLRDMGPGSA